MREALMHRVQSLAARLPWLGVGPDLAALPLADLWGVCRLLERLAAEAQRGAAS
jgi:hypothetical protein